MVFLAGMLIIAMLLLSMTQPTGLVCLAMAAGAIPLALGDTTAIDSPIGRFDVAALRLLGLWIAALCVVTLHWDRVSTHLGRYAWHMAFLGLCILSIAYSPDFSFGVRMFLKLSAPLLVLLLVLAAVTSGRDARLVAKCILFSGIALAAIAFGTTAAGINPDPRLNVPGMGPSTFSAHLVVVAMMALAHAVVHRRVLSLVIFALLAAAVIAAFTRISIAALFVGASVILLIGTRGFVRIALPLAAGLALPALFLLNERFRNRMFIDGENVSAGMVLTNPSSMLEHVHGSGRFALWEQILGRFYEPSPIVGSGLGATQQYLYTSSLGAQVAHSEYVRLLSEVGILGTLLFAIAMAMYLWHALKNAREARDNQARLYGLAAAGGVVAYVIFAATDNALDYVNQFGAYVFALIGLSEKMRGISHPGRLLAAEVSRPMMAVGPTNLMR